MPESGSPNPVHKASSVEGDDDASTSQFALLSKRRFLPLFVTQFFGVFNDNLYKQALAVIFVYSALVSEAQIDFLVNAAAALFIAPFFLFSAVAGNLADNRDKAWLMRRVKLAEIFVAAAAGLALLSGSVTMMLVVLFLFGVQSTLFGPAKFAILPQHLKSAELVGGNAIVQTGTFVAILLGTIAGGVIGATGNVTLVLFVFVVSISTIGYIASRAIPPAPPRDSASVKTRWLRDTWALIEIARERRAVFFSVLGISWFWLLGSVYLTQIPNLVKSNLYGNPSLVTTILTIFTVAIAIGSLACERLSGKRVEIGLVPLGALGVSVFGLDAYFAIEALDPAPLRNGFAFLGAEGATRVLMDLALIGVFAGLFVVPLQATIQARTPEEKRARVIAANNVINSFFMVGGAGLAVLWLGILDLAIPSLFIVLSVLNLLFAIYIFREVPEFAARFVIWMASHSTRRVRYRHLARIPATGGAIVVANGVGPMSALFLAGALDRPLRFVVDASRHDSPLVNFVMRAGRAVTIDADRDRDVLALARDTIRAGLADGDVFCFVTSDVSLGARPSAGPFGVEEIVAATGVPVVPMVLEGFPGRFFSRVEISVGHPIGAQDVSPDALHGGMRGAPA